MLKTEWPQIVVIVCTVATMCIKARNHGKPKFEKEDFFSWLICLIIENILLYFGGFWTK